MLASLLLAASAAAASTYSVDPARAEAGFALQATMHTVHGTTSKVAGRVTATGDPGGARELSGRIEIDAASLDTANSKRDETLHGTTLAVSRYPKIVFVPERFTPSGPLAPDGTLSGTISGQMTLRETTHPVAIAATLHESAAAIDVDGTFDVAWPEYGLPDPSFLFVHVAKIAHAYVKVRLLREETSAP